MKARNRRPSVEKAGNTGDGRSGPRHSPPTVSPQSARSGRSRTSRAVQDKTVGAMLNERRPLTRLSPKPSFCNRQDRAGGQCPLFTCAARKKAVRFPPRAGLQRRYQTSDFNHSHVRRWGRAAARPPGGDVQSGTGAEEQRRARDTDDSVETEISTSAVHWSLTL